MLKKPAYLFSFMRLSRKSSSRSGTGGAADGDRADVGGGDGGATRNSSGSRRWRLKNMSAGLRWKRKSAFSFHLCQNYYSLRVGASAGAPPRQPHHGWRKSTGGHTIARGGRRAATPWPDEADGRPRNGQMQQAGSHAIVGGGKHAATPWPKDVGGYGGHAMAG
nr:AF211538_1 Avr9/Cf-9 rapidly elicited protein 180 [Ipomoea batatas]